MISLDHQTQLAQILKGYAVRTGELWVQSQPELPTQEGPILKQNESFRFNFLEPILITFTSASAGRSVPITSLLTVHSCSENALQVIHKLQTRSSSKETCLANVQAYCLEYRLFLIFITLKQLFNLVLSTFQIANNFKLKMLKWFPKKNSSKEL